MDHRRVQEVSELAERGLYRVGGREINVTETRRRKDGAVVLVVEVAFPAPDPEDVHG
jgi:hypothetical protein